MEGKKTPWFSCNELIRELLPNLGSSLQKKKSFFFFVFFFPLTLLDQNSTQALDSIY